MVALPCARIVEIGRMAANRSILTLKEDVSDFFPKEALVGTSSSQNLVRLVLEGFQKPVLTGLTAINNKRRTWTFQNKSWVKPFLRKNSLGVGDRALLFRVRPDEYRVTPLWRDFTVIDLFAGIGGLRLGYEAVGGRSVFASEIDLDCQLTYEANFGNKPFGDITQICPDSIPDHDVLLAGFPCQPFSIIGNREGFGDIRGTLFFSIEEILRAKRPPAILLENVKQFRTHNGGRTSRTVLRCLQELGYHTQINVLNALDYGVPQKRERTFIVGFQEDLRFSWPQPVAYRPSLEEVFESDEEVDSKLFASDYIQQKRLARLKQQGRTPFFPSMWHENKGGYIGIHPFSCALRANASYSYLLVNGRRRPSGRECLRLQGFPDSFKIVVKHAAIRAQAGNAVAVPVIAAIASRMMVSLHSKTMASSTLFPELVTPLTDE